MEEEDLYVAPQWKLVWWRFRRHRVAVISALVIILFYLIAIFAEFLAIHDPQAQSAKRAFVPPQRIHFEGMRPFVYGLEDKRNPETLQMEHYPDLSKKYPLQFFVEGHKYKLLGLFETNIHLAGLDVAQLDDEDRALMPLYPLGTDRLGRDSWSRLMYGTRISMSIGLVGVGLSLFLGILLGGISGYRGGRADIIIQRLIELRRAMPTIPLWLGLGAAVPQQWSVVKVYFAMTIIISLIGWTTLAREVRGRFLAMREEDYILACRLQGVSELRIIFRHMLPGFVSHIIATTTLAIPAIIIAETSLSFLGLGLRAPAISWGTLLFEAQNLQSVANAPWLLMPGSFLLVAVLAFNFAGDGLRDAADPYQVQQ
ncbi:ABC transporter permease [Chloroflexi bacterium TSY]|nr:ABC transporter permease [Chloroflexi bacterium TSY]